LPTSEVGQNPDQEAEDVKNWMPGFKQMNDFFFFVFEWKICNCSSVDLPDNEKWEDNLHSDETKISIISMSN
jgi:hypothetical protein